MSGVAAAAVIIWFRNDLRLADNAALMAAVDAAGASRAAVVPVFVSDTAAAAPWSPGGAQRWWLHESLLALSRALEARGSRLVLRRGDAAGELVRLARETGAASVHCARRYEPWAIRQEEACRVALEQAGVPLKRYAGGLLIEPEQLSTKAGGYFKVYTPFWRAVCERVTPVRPLKAPSAISAPARFPRSDKLDSWRLQPERPDWARGFRDHWQPGEQGALGRLDAFLKSSVADYTEKRNRPDLPGTSLLSPHLTHGEISPRLVWWRAAALRDQRAATAAGLETFLKELVWREFSQHLLFHVPSLPEASFRPEFEAFAWRTDSAALKAWQRGRTGYPIVDAGLRELWATGFMHNRVRMVVASFLIKHLLIDWREGERWFWDTLLDADLGNNAAGWQWVAGSGADAAPYFRIFNPVTQGEKFDPHGDYVRRWVPEIARLPDKVVHRPFAADAATLKAAGVVLGENYPAPLVDHAAARARALATFAALKQNSPR